MKAMILAAGKGERMMPLTANTPKPLLTVKGKSLIQHQIEKLKNHGIIELVINYSYLGEQIEQALGDGSELGVTIQYSPEEHALETAGGIFQALPLLGRDSFIVVNADIWTDYSFNELPVLTGDEYLAHLVMVDNADHHSEGDYLLREGALAFPQAGGDSALTYSGIAVYHPNFFAGVDAGKQALRPLLDLGVSKSKISGEYFQGMWIDVGTPQRLQSLQ